MQHAKLYILYQFSVKGYSVHTCKKCYDPICVHYHITCSWSVFWNHHCVRSSSLQYGASHYSLFIQRSMRAEEPEVKIGLPDTLPCCCHSPTSPSTPISSKSPDPRLGTCYHQPTRATTPPSGRWAPWPRSRISWRAPINPTTSNDAVSFAKQAKLVASSIKSIISPL